MNLKISKKISEIRNSNKLTQEDLAEILGVARQTISNWENDKCYPDIETIILISDKFNISLDILLKEDKEMIKKIDKSVRLNKINKKIWMILVILVIVLFFLGYKFYLFNKYNVYSDSDLKFSIQELIVNVDKSIANRDFEDMHIFIPEEYTENIDNDYIYELNNESAISLYKYDTLDWFSKRISENENINYEKIYKKYDISNELDLITYFEENKDKNIFQSKDAMQMNYLANRYISYKYALKDEYYYLEGDLKGLVESEKYRYLVIIFDKDESYIISLNKDMYSYEDVVNTLKTIYFE